MGNNTGVYTSLNGYQIVPYTVADGLRKADMEKRNPYVIISQSGGQERLLTSPADITIYGGQRGGAKSFSLLLDALHDIYNPEFRAVIVRKELGDLENLINESIRIYSAFGDYNRSKGDTTWNFKNGGTLKFDFYGGLFKDFQTRFQGKQFSQIGIDEITHMDYPRFRYIMSDNRNTASIRNRIIGTCNPDPESWVARFIDWWIGEDGYPIEDRSGVVRYCFMDGEDIQDVVWGDSREEVYLKCKGTIDRLYTPQIARFGSPQDTLIMSVCFIIGRLDENLQLLRSDPSYFARLANQSEEKRQQDLYGNWKFKATSDDYIKPVHMDAFFANAHQKGDGILRASCDLALGGGDNLVMWLWEGDHIQDVHAIRHIDSTTAIAQIRYKLDMWGVDQRNFTYDVQGIGQMMQGFFPKAIPFNNQEAPVNAPKGTFANIKSQCAFMLADDIIDGKISINPNILSRKFTGTGYTNKTLEEILRTECKIIRPDETRSNGGRNLPNKASMRRLIGHSPDFIEALLMGKVFKLKKNKSYKGLGLL